VVHGDMSRTKPSVKPVVEQESIYQYGTFVRVLPGSDL